MLMWQIRELEDKKKIQKLLSLGTATGGETTYFIKELIKLRDEFEVVGDVRGKGLMIGVEMVKDKVRSWKVEFLLRNAVKWNSA